MNKNGVIAALTLVCLGYYVYFLGFKSGFERGKRTGIDAVIAEIEKYNSQKF